MPTLKDWLQTESDSPPPFAPDPAEMNVNRQQMRSLLNSSAAPGAPADLSELQLARAYKRSKQSPRQIYKLIKQGVSIPRLANALGMPPELIQEMVKREQAIVQATGPARQAVKLYESGLTFPQIGEKLKVSEAEARHLYARGHVSRHGANPAVQIGRREGTAFPPGVFKQPTYVSDTNRGNPVIANIISSLRKQLEPQGYMLETFFEADALGGRHVVKLVQDGQMVGEPFRLTATPNGVPLVSKTGKAGGGYRLTQQGRGMGLAERLGQVVLQMAANHKASQARRVASAGAAPPWADEEPPLWNDDAATYPQGDDLNFNDSPPPSPPPPPPWEGAAPPSGPTGLLGDANGRQNVLDLLEVNAKHNESLWRQISAADFMRLSHAGRFREENAESLVKDPVSKQWVYPEGLSGFTPIVSKGTVYPLEARNHIPGNVELENGRQWGSQAKMGKQLKRDELSLTRKYWQAGPALGVAYHQTPQHILGQHAEQPEMAYTARAFILDRGGIIPEGQMWKDVSFAPWVFGSFEQAPEKYELRFDANYSETEVLAAAGLLGPDGKFRPRVLRHGDKVAAPNGFSKDLLRNNEAGVITGYEIAESLNERGELVKALRFKGYFGNRPNVVSAMKLEGWKNLAQDKHIRQGMGINADIITNKPSDSVVANISMLNALPRSEFEDLWREVHGNTSAPTRTGSMAEVEALAKVTQRLQEKNRATEILRGQVVDADTRDNYLKAGIVRDNKYEEVPPLFEGAEPMYRMDLIASGYYAPVRTNFITDVTNLRRGHLSNEILRNVERNFPGLGEHLRDLGYRERDIYNTLFEMHQLNTKWPGEATKPGYSEHGSPVVDLIGDLTGKPEARAGMQALYEQKLQEILPESMRGLNPTDYTEAQQKAYRKFKNEAGAQAIRHYYDDALGSDSYIFRLGNDDASDEVARRGQYPKGYQEAAYMANPGLVERFGYIDEETNERLSKLRSEGDYQLKSVWEAVQSGQPGLLAGRLKKLPGRMKDVTRNQAQLLASVGARKKWFGTTDSSIFTHVHASDYALPRNAMAAGWADIFRMTGLKRTKANQARLNKLSQAGQLLFSGLRNPASDPVAQTGTILNMLTPDLLKAAGLDIPTTGHPILFHPHQVQRQGGDNDSDESQVYMVMKKMAGELVNAFGLTPTDPALITAGARRHAAGEYDDAVEKLNVSEAKARQNLLGFDPTQPALELAGSTFTPEQWTNQTLVDYQNNARQIGQAYNIPIRVGLNLSKNPAAQAAISEYGGWLYQNPLDKVNYPLGSPEEDLFKFFTSFDAMLGSFAGSDHDLGRYYSYRPSAGFENRGQFGAVGLLAILKRLTQDRAGTQAQMTPRQMAGFMAGSAGDLDKLVDTIDQWPLPDWDQLDTQAIKGLKLSEMQQKALGHFAEGDSALAQMMRGYAVRTGIKSAARMQRKLQEEMQDPANWAGASNQFKGNLRNYLNIFQNEMYRYGQGIGSAEFKRDYEKFNALFGQSSTSNWFNILEPGSKTKAPGEFYSWPVEKRQKFYNLTARLLQKHVTGYGRDENKIWRNLDSSVARSNPYFKDWYADYDRIRDMMAVNAPERDTERDIEGYAPSLEELDRSEVTGPLVREKYTRKQKLLGGLSRLFETYKGVTGLNGQAEAGQDFENFVIGRKPYTLQEAEMFRQAELGHQEAAELRAKKRRREGYEEPLYFAEGGVLNRPTKLGETRSGRDVVGGEAGREYVVPEGKTHDLGGGLKLFDTDELGQGAPEGSSPVLLAKGGILDYQAYANAPTSGFGDAIRHVADELSGGRFTGDVEAASDVVRQKIEADIRQLAANAPQNGLAGLMASSLPGRATELMALALGPNPTAADFSTWNDLLAEYGLSAEMQPLGVNPQQISPTIKRQLQQQAGGDPQTYKAALAGYMKDLNSQLAGKAFSHANYGNVYNTIPGWQGYWNTPSGRRPASTIPAIALSDVAQTNLARLMGGIGGNGGQPPQEPGAPGESGSAGGPNGPNQIRGKEITAYAQPFSPQTVEMYKTLSEKLSKYADTIEELNLKGGTLAEASGEAAQVIKAAGKTYHRLEGQYSRAQRVIRYDSLQTKFDAFQYREGEPLTDAESREFVQLQEQMVKPTGADISAAMKVKGYIQDIFPVYAEREAAGRRGTRLPRQMIANSPLAWAAQIAGRDPSLVKEARQAERQGLRLSQIDQRLGDIREFYAASGSGRLDAFNSSRSFFEDAAQVSMWSSQRQAAYEAAVPLKRQFDQAMAQGDMGQAQRLYDQIHPLNVEIGELKDQIGILTPHLKEHIDTLGEQTGVIREDLKERKATYSALAAKEKQLQAEKIDLAGAARMAKAADIGLVRGEMDTVKGEIKSQAKELGRLSYEKRTLTDLLHEPQGRQITGLGSRPQTYGQMAMNELKKGYDPQRLFWQFQNIQQLQYMAFMPMLGMRSQYLGEQAALGQAQYALGAGSMPESVLSAMAAQANMSRAQASFGRGVDNSMAMNAWKGFTTFLGQNEGAGSFLGSLGFDLTSGLAATMGLQMLGKPAFSAIGKLAGGLGVQSAPYLLPAGGPGLAATTGAALLSGGGLVAGGLGVGLGLSINEYLASQQAGGNILGLDWQAIPFSQHATVAAYEAAGYSGDKWGGAFNPLNNAILRGLADQSGLASFMGWDLWNQEKADRYGTAVGKYTGAVTDPIPVWITKMEAEVAKQLGVSQEELPFDRTELAQMVQMAAEDQGITKKQLEESPGIAAKLAAEIADSYKSGVSMSQSSGLRQRAIEVSGYAPGTEGARMMSEWVKQGSLFERQQRLGAAAMVQNLADTLDFTPEQRREISQKVYGLLAEGVSQSKVSRALQQAAMSNQYYWSAAAYEAGHPSLALFDQAAPWRPKYQADTWAIEDRRRGEDNRREWGRAETQLGWQSQSLKLDETAWNLNRRHQLADFLIGQKFFDFQLKQMRFGLDREERQSQMSNRYQERQYQTNKQMFDLQTAWQLADFDKQEQRLAANRAWQLEDFAWNRDSFELQSGWQMEDLSRSLRYASGRQRMDIRRQMERAGILADRQRTEMDREEGRAEVKQGWAEDDLATQRRRFEELRPLQEEQMAMGRQYWQEQKQFAEEDRGLRRAMMEEQIGLMTERNELNKTQFYESRELAGQNHTLEQQMANQKLQWATADLKLAKERAAEDEKMLGWQREMTVAQQQYTAYAQMGYEWSVKHLPVIQSMVTAAQQLAGLPAYGGRNAPVGGSSEGNAGGGGSLNRPERMSFAQGGPVPETGLALVHQNEYVVPQHGALVMRDESLAQGVQRTNELLSAILQAVASNRSGGAVDLGQIVEGIVASGFNTTYRVG